METEREVCFKINYFVLMSWFKPSSPKGTILEKRLGKKNSSPSLSSLPNSGILRAELLEVSPYTWQVYIERKIPLGENYQHPGLMVIVYQDVRLAEVTFAKNMFVTKIEKEKLNHMLSDWLRQVVKVE